MHRTPTIFILLTTALSALSGPSSAQTEGMNWCFGTGGAFDFNRYYPDPRSSAIAAQEGCSSISDLSGNLLLYTDGKNLWNGTHQQLAGDLLGSPGATQSSLILKQPGNNDLYYVFAVDEVGTVAAPGRGISYSIYNISRGDFEPGLKNGTLLPRCAEKITAIKRRNSSDYWILTHEINLSVFRVFLLTEAGLADLPDQVSYQVIGLTHTVDGDGKTINESAAYGCMKASPDGKLVALAIEGNNRYEVFDFDNQTGILSRPRQITGNQGETDFGAYGIEFSPTGRYLYGTNRLAGIVYRWSLDSYDELTIRQSRQVIRDGGESKCGALQLAPNGRIYVALPGQDYLGVIRAPDFDNCRYREQGASLVNPAAGARGTCGYGLPNFPADYFRQMILYTDDCSGDQTTLYLADNELFDYPPDWYVNSDLIQSHADQVGYPFAGTGLYRVHLLGEIDGIKVNTIDRLIFIQPLPEPDYHDQGAVCGGSPYELISDEWAFWQWTMGSERDTARLVNKPGKYVVAVSNYQGCSSSYQTEITSGPVPEIESIQIDPAGCGLSDGSIRIEMKGGPEGYHFNWDRFPNDTLNYLQHLPAGDYNVEINSDNCGHLDTTLTVPNRGFSISLAANPRSSPVCTGTEVILTASGADTYIWESPAGLSGNGITWKMTQTETFRVIGYKGACRGTAELKIEVFPSYPLELGDPVTVCQGDIVEINRDDLEFGGEYQDWSWSTGSTDDHIELTQSIIGLSLEVTDRNGCRYSDDISVTFRPLPVFTPDVTNVSCYGNQNGQIELQVGGRIWDYYYSIDGGSGWSDQNLFTGLAPDTFTLGIKEKLEPGCASLLETETISEPDEITARDSVRKSFCETCSDGEIWLKITGGTGPYSVTANGETFSEQGEYYYLNKLTPGTYTVTITDQNGCEKNLDIQLEAEPLFIPNAFSPNEGGTKNQTWEIDGLEGSEVWVQVFDRGGILVYENQGTDYQPWNGKKMNDGKKLPAGIYFYRIKITRDKKTEEFRGTVTIVR